MIHIPILHFLNESQDSQEDLNRCNHIAAVQPDSSHDLGNPGNQWELNETIIRNIIIHHWKGNKGITFWNSSLCPMIFTLFQWNHMASDSVRSYSQGLGTPRSHRRNMSGSDNICTPWKGSETVYVFFMISREFPRASNLRPIWFQS